MLVALAYAPLAGWPRFLAYLVPYLVIGYDILRKAGKGIRNRQAFDESLLMAIATVGAMALAVYEDGDYTEAVAVMLFYQIGEWFQSYAVGRSRRDISELMDIRPDYANVEGEDGQLERVEPDEVEVGTRIVVKPGESMEPAREMQAEQPRGLLRLFDFIHHQCSSMDFTMAALRAAATLANSSKDT